MIQPLSVRSPLAGTPENPPKYGLKVKWNGADFLAADPRATRALVALMDMNAVIGGAASHYGGPAAFAELMSAVHLIMFEEAKQKRTPWHELYNFVNDAGHCENGLYALKANYGFADLTFNKLKGFRSLESVLTGHGESHLFPEGVLMSNGPLGSAFPQSQGLAMADALANKNRVTVTAISDGACMEGEAKEAMAAIPGLAAKGQMAPFVLIISDNNTKLSGRIDKDSFSMEPTFKALQTLGWKLVTVQDGHDLQKCVDVISASIVEARSNPKVPIAIHAKTIKGMGTRKTMESSSGGHGFPLKSATELTEFLKEIYDGTSVPEEFMTWIAESIELEKKMKAQAVKPTEPTDKIQAGVSAALIRARKEGLPVVSLTSDLPGSTGVAGFRKDFPEASLDVGVAESNMISAAAGFSKAGFIPVVDTFAQFGVTKGALPLTMASLSQSPIICIFSHTGFQDAADGASHQALSYFAMVSSIPHVKTVALTCSEEAEVLVYQAIQKFAEQKKRGETPESIVFFLGRENFPKTFGSKYEFGKAQIVKETSPSSAKKVTLIGVGSSFEQVVWASKKLEEQGIGSVVVNPSFINAVDVKTMATALAKTSGLCVVVEDHQLMGGFSQHLSFVLSQKGISFKMNALGVHGEFGQSAYTSQDLYRKHKIDSESVVAAALSLLGS